jgi:hypothetical protein
VHVSDVNRINIMFFDYWYVRKYFPKTKIYDVGCGKAESFQLVADEIVKRTGTGYEYIKNPYNKKNYQFYTKANIRGINKIYKSLYGIEYKPINIKVGIDNDVFAGWRAEI